MEKARLVSPQVCYEVIEIIKCLSFCPHKCYSHPSWKMLLFGNKCRLYQISTTSLNAGIDYMLTGPIVTTAMQSLDTRIRENHQIGSRRKVKSRVSLPLQLGNILQIWLGNCSHKISTTRLPEQDLHFDISWNANVSPMHTERKEDAHWFKQSVSNL